RAAWRLRCAASTAARKPAIPRLSKWWACSAIGRPNFVGPLSALSFHEFRWPLCLSANPSKRSREHQAQAPTANGEDMRKVTGIAVGQLLAVGATPALAWEPTKPVE